MATVASNLKDPAWPELVSWVQYLMKPRFDWVLPLTHLGVLVEYLCHQNSKSHFSLLFENLTKLTFPTLGISLIISGDHVLLPRRGSQCQAHVSLSVFGSQAGRVFAALFKYYWQLHWLKWQNTEPESNVHCSNLLKKLLYFFLTKLKIGTVKGFSLPKMNAIWKVFLVKSNLE